MKSVLLAVPLLTGCVVLADKGVPSFNNPYKINESNYLKTPCLVDGAIVKKKPKIINAQPNGSSGLQESKKR